MQTHQWLVTCAALIVTACGAPAEEAAPKIDIRPGRLDFRCPPAGCAQEVTLHNSGTGVLVIGTVRITGPNAREFRHNAKCAGNQLAGGESCGFEVFFTPGLSSTSYAQLGIGQASLDLKGELTP